jgi:hypothetical protein
MSDGLSQFTDEQLRKAQAGDFSSFTTEQLMVLRNAMATPAAPTAPAQRSVAQDLVRQLGLTSRAALPAMTGAAMGGMVGGPPGAAIGALGVGLGTMAVDPLVSLFNRATGYNVPTASQGFENIATQMGLPAPVTPTERVVSDIVRAGTSTVGSARGAGVVAQNLAASNLMRGQAAGVPSEVFNLLSRYPAQQAAAAGAAGAAGGTLRESGASPGAQMGGAMLAGMVAPGSPKLPFTQRALAAPATMVQPFTQAGREVIVGNVLNRLATNPEAAQARLAGAAPLVPGVRPTTAGTAYDPGLAASETAIRALDQSGAFPSQISGNQQALLDAYRRLSGGPGSIPYAETKRAGITGPMREQAFENRAPVTADAIEAQIQATMSDPMKQRGVVLDAMQEVRRLINARKAPDGTLDPAALYSVRKDIADMMSGRLQGEKANLRLARGELSDLLPVIDNTIDSGAPGFIAYMEKYRKMSGPIDQMRLLQDIERRVTTGQPNLMTGEPVLAAGALRRQLATRAEEIGADLSPAAQRRLDAIITEINRGMAATAPGVKVPGSDTFRNMSMGNMIGKIFSESMASNTTLRTMTRPLDFLYKLPDDKIQQLLVEAMLDPQTAAVLMSRANMMKVEPLAKSLREKAIRLGMGSAIGAAQE